MGIVYQGKINMYRLGVIHIQAGNSTNNRQIQRGLRLKESMKGHTKHTRMLLNCMLYGFVPANLRRASQMLLNEPQKAQTDFAIDQTS
jgi:hypothetical protein